MDTTMFEQDAYLNYLASVLTPVRQTSTEHIIRDQVSVVFLSLAHTLGQEIHPGLSQVLRVVP